MIKKEIQDSIEVKHKILNDNNLIKQIENIANECLKSLINGGKIILAGNGGSFADAQHISAEFTSRYILDRDSLPSICLGTNNSAISAIANDYGYDKVFSRELSSIGNQDDIFIAITTSGNSKNIIEAIKVANQKKIKTFVLTGEAPVAVSDLCECVNVPSRVTGRIQESHILIGHIVCGIVERDFFKDFK
ncbi:SIS domain-containing protein [Sulfurimonas sp.]|uniref:D-sedoheptulose-7-phosphate isomerase n=1 Tax=Sulfurimonas sp. TaxID=2022749 RepID=UPI0025EE259B|nr:SIS domain-containing protein [Sulfurimonas sp.]